MARIIKFISIFLFICFLIVFIGLIFLRNYYYTQINAKNNTPQTHFTINQGDSIQTVASNLYKANEIQNTTVFVIYLKLNNLDKAIEAGTYLIPQNANIIQIADLLQNGKFFTNITITEGLRLEEQADSIDKQLSVNNTNKVFDKNEYIQLAKTPSAFNYPFLDKNTKSLEGFLFPDTYQVSKNVTAKEVITQMMDNFSNKIYSSFKGNNNLSFYQNLILASIIEREAKTTNDRRMIADILMRRLSDNYPLAVDSTIQYSLGFSASEKTWWRQNIYQADLTNNTPYNTRINPGLPPTPICNPGQDSFNATQNPIPNQYYYYISDKQGIIHYAVTLDQQNANIAKYLN